MTVEQPCSLPDQKCCLKQEFGDPRFWALLKHYASEASSKMWRANAEPVLEKLMPKGFDPSSLPEYYHPNLLELALRLVPRHPEFEPFIEKQIHSSIKVDGEFWKVSERSLMILKRLANGPVLSGLDFDFFLECFKQGPILQPLAIAGFVRQCKRKTLDSSLFEDRVAIPLLIHHQKFHGPILVNAAVLEACFNYAKRKFILINHHDNSIDTSGLSPIIRLWYSIITQRQEEPELIELALYLLDLEKMLPEGLDPNLEPLLTGKAKEKLTIAVLESLLNRGANLSRFNQAVVKTRLAHWSWILNRPALGRLFLSTISPIAPILVETSVMLESSPLFWKRLIEAQNFASKELIAAATRRRECREATLFLWLAAFDCLTEYESTFDFDSLAQHMDIEGSWLMDSRAREYLVKNVEYFERHANLRLAAIYAQASIKLTSRGREKMIAYIIDNIELPQVCEYARMILKGDPREAEILGLLFGPPITDAAVLQAQYEALMEPLENDHDHVVGYASCHSECYCD